MTFVRRNRLQFSVTFTPPPGIVAVPSAAHATLQYRDTSGALRTDTVQLVMQPDKSWTGVWDSSNAAQGRVEWMAWSEGALQCATQGAFEVKANRANMAVG